MVRTKMDRGERAKQFMPFSALKGYEEALRKKEKSVVPQIRKIRPMQSKENEKIRPMQSKENEKIRLLQGKEDEKIRP